jgi:hypothetical protein
MMKRIISQSIIKVYDDLILFHDQLHIWKPPYEIIFHIDSFNNKKK